MEDSGTIAALSPELAEKFQPAAQILNLNVVWKKSAEEIIALRPHAIIAEASLPADLNVMYRVRQVDPAATRILAFSTQAIPLNVAIAMRLGHRFIDLSRDPAEVASVIADAIRLTEIFGTPAIQKCVRDLAFLPRLPNLFIEVEEAVHAPGASLSRAAQIIEKDQTVTAHLLKLVNAAAFAGNRPITRVGDAVTRIGINNLKALILAVSLFSGRVKQGHTVDFNSVHTHAFVTAQCARLIAQNENLPSWSQDLLFLAGLLHDLGSLVLITSQPGLYEKTLLKAMSENGDMMLMERAVFGTDHAVLGGYISRLWGFPDMVSELIVEHHNPEKEDISFRIIEAADTIAQKVLYYGRGEAVPANRAAPENWLRHCKPVVDEALAEK